MNAFRHSLLDQSRFETVRGQLSAGSRRLRSPILSLLIRKAAKAESIDAFSETMDILS